MLKGYLKCADISKMLLSYIHFELSKREMARVALHLRNCPNCMEKYTRIQRRKKELKLKMLEIEKTLRMQMEISTYMDNEGGEDLNFIIEGMLYCDENYKRELIQNEELRRLMHEFKKRFTRKVYPKETMKIIARLKMKKRAKEKMYENLIRFFRPLRHVFAKYV